MKLNIALLLLSLAGSASAGPVTDCVAQNDCFTWETSIKDTDSCSLGGPCQIEVCMVVNTGGDCDKKGGTMSHACDFADTNGCPNNGDYNTPDSGAEEDKEDCISGTITGQGGDLGTGKCDDSFGPLLTMCAIGVPGTTLKFLLKDGNGNGETFYLESENSALSDPFLGDAGCEAIVECKYGEYSCGMNTQQLTEERTWYYTIPAISEACNYCDTEAPTGSPVAVIPEVTSGDPEVGAAPAANKPLPPAASPSASNTPPTPGTPPAASPTASNNPGNPSGSNGDPHFKTWQNEHFEYHGQCDLVLAKDDEFADGLGLDVQIRTKLVRFWSYIHRAAIRIGDDILEVQGTGDVDDIATANYWMNFEFQAELSTIGGFPVTLAVSEVNSKKRHFTIDLSSKYPGVKINIHTFREFIRVDFEGHSEEAFGNAVGMLGDYKTGKTLARDGVTVLDDFTKLGNEWQVLPVEHMLFHDIAEPQFPKKCIEPEDPQGERRRRLAEATVSEEQAEAACAHLKDALDRKDCVYDILATQDLDMVGAF